MNDLITRKEAIEAVDFFAVDPGDGWNDIANERNRVLEYVSDKIMHIPPAQQWTPIDKDWPDRGELPDDCVSVLISIEYEVCESYREGDYWFLDETFVPLDFADAWMFMPKPYKGEA